MNGSKANDPNDMIAQQIKKLASHTIKENDGEFLDSYHIGKLIGKGTLGEVRECEHKISHQKRAVRIVFKKYLDSELLNQLFTQRVLCQVFDHPNLLSIFETFQDSKRFFIVTELLTGGELFHQIENHANAGTLFTEEEAATIVDQSLKALRYLHLNKLFLMDLKPENILFSSKMDSLVKLIDFEMV